MPTQVVAPSVFQFVLDAHNLFYCFCLLHGDRDQQPQAYLQIMELDTIVQVVFGILSALIAVFGIWLAWRSRGKSLYCLQGLYPAVAPRSFCPSMLTVRQSGTCRNGRPSLCCPCTAITHLPKADTSRARLCIILLGGLPSTAAHIWCRLHNKMAGCSILSVDSSWL